MTTVNGNIALFLRAPDGAAWRAMFFLPGHLVAPILLHRQRYPNYDDPTTQIGKPC